MTHAQVYVNMKISTCSHTATLSYSYAPMQPGSHIATLTYCYVHTLLRSYTVALAHSQAHIQPRSHIDTLSYSQAHIQLRSDTAIFSKTVFTTEKQPRQAFKALQVAKAMFLLYFFYKPLRLSTLSSFVRICSLFCH